MSNLLDSCKTVLKGVREIIATSSNPEGMCKVAELFLKRATECSGNEYQLFSQFCHHLVTELRSRKDYVKQF